MRFVKSLLPALSPRFLSEVLPLLLLVSLLSNQSYAAAPDRITGTVSNGQKVILRGNVHHKALPQYDQGPADPALRLGTMTILTLPTVSQRKGLIKFVAEQQNPSSPNYHKWLTPQQWADRFGLSQHDVQQIALWLKSQGFTAIRMANGRNWVSFNGTAAQVESAFGTEIHRYSVNGELHYANATAPSVPAGLGGVISRIRGLHDFRPKPAGIHRVQPDYYSSALQSQYLAPGDIATIYDIVGLGSAIDGTGQKLAVMGQTDIYLADITDFRTGFGLSAINCTTNPTTGVITACSDPHFQYVLEGSDPGVLTGDNLEEADLDLEWSGAIAPGATIVFVNSTDVFTSFYDAIDDVGTLGESVISLSYGSCEFGDNDILDPSTGLPGPDETELLKANAEGITFVNSAGDSGAAACDPNSPYTNSDPNGESATGGLAVSYPASSPEVTAVGGTAIPLANFSSTYWGTSNGTGDGSVLPDGPQQGYIPEQAWNDDAEFAQLCEGVTSSNPNYEFCTQGGSKKVPGWVPITSAETAQSDFAITNTGISAGGGGVSNCARQNSAFSACVSGFAQPSWQTVTVPTSPQPSGRLSPDVSLLATPDFPGYIFCTPLSELGESGSGSSCANGIATAVYPNFSLIGGTSVSAPVFAGIVTLLNQYLGKSGLGNINPTLYTLAGNTASGAFHPVTTGNNLVYCTAGTPVSTPAQPSTMLCPNTGVLGFQASNEDSNTGYNPVTGLGSVDVNKLFMAFAAPPPNFTLGVAAPASATVVAGNTTSPDTITITPVNGYSVATTLSCPSGLPAGATCTFTPNPVPANGTQPVQTVLTIGTSAGMAATASPATVIISATGSGVTNTASFALSVTATNQTFTLTALNASPSVSPGSLVNATITLVPGPNGFSTPVTYTCTDKVAESQCTGPTGPQTGFTHSFSITTTAPTSSQTRPFGRGMRIFYAALLPGLLGIMVTVGSRKRSLRSMRLMGMICLLGGSTLWLGSCSGSGGGIKNAGTPPGTYTVVISATTGGANPVSNNVTINVTVN
jgi:subtilase family serine protease